MGTGGTILGSVLVWAQTSGSVVPRLSASVPLVLAGGTVVDVTDWVR